MTDTEISEKRKVSEAYTEAAEAYIRKLFADRSDGHDAEHSMRVYRNAMMIAETEPDCDPEIVALGALLHDTDDHKLFHTENNANARAFLSGLCISQEKTDLICRVINSVSFSRNRGHRPDTAEGRIVQDADRLDAIGAVGIARTFAYGGKHSRTMAQTLQHFDEKLLLLKDEMNTPCAKKIAESRHAFMELFLQEMEKETSGRQ